MFENMNAGPVIGYLLAAGFGFAIGYFMSYSKQKGANRADIEDREILTKIESTVKESIEFGFSLKKLGYETEKEIIIKTFELSLLRFQEVLSRIEQLAAIHRTVTASKRDPTEEEANFVWRTRLLIMECQIYLPDDIFDLVWTIHNDYDTLIENAARQDQGWADHSSKVSAELRQKHKNLIGLGRKRFRINALDDLMEEMQARKDASSSEL